MPWRDYMQLMRADKPIGTLLLLWPTTWALWLSGGEFVSLGWQIGSFDPHVAVVFIAGVFLMRSSGCVINDFADRDFDRHVERTKDRPLTAGRVGVFETLCLFLMLIFLALLLVLTLDNEVRYQVLMAAIPALLIAVAYPFMKRFFVTPQLVLGIAFSCSIPMAYLAQDQPMNWGMLSLVLANLAWVVAYDTIYALVDKKDDEAIGIFSSARFFGNNVIKIIVTLQILTVGFLLLTGIYYSLNAYFYYLLLLCSACFVYQLVLIQDQKRDQCFTAFVSFAYRFSIKIVNQSMLNKVRVGCLGFKKLSVYG